MITADVEAHLQRCLRQLRDCVALADGTGDPIMLAAVDILLDTCWKLAVELATRLGDDGPGVTVSRSAHLLLFVHAEAILPGVIRDPNRNLH